MCQASRWRPFSQSSFPSVRVTGWPPSIFGKLPCRFQSIRNRVPSSRPIHGPAGFHTGLASCFCHPPLAGYLHALLPRRLARPVLLSGGSPPRSPGRPGSLLGAGYCGQPRGIQPRSLSGCPVSRGGPQYPVFYGFSVDRSCLQALVYSRGIYVLRFASRQCLALSAEGVFLHGSCDIQHETMAFISYVCLFYACPSL